MSTCAGQYCKHIRIKCFLNPPLNFITFDLTNVWGITSTKLTNYKVQCLIFNPFCCKTNGYFDVSICAGQCCKHILNKSFLNSHLNFIKLDLTNMCGITSTMCDIWFSTHFVVQLMVTLTCQHVWVTVVNTLGSNVFWSLIWMFWAPLIQKSVWGITSTDRPTAKFKQIEIELFIKLSLIYFWVEHKIFYAPLNICLWPKNV